MFPVPLDRRSRSAGHGRAQRVEPVRSARAGIDVFQYRFGGIRIVIGILLRPILHLSAIEGMAIGVVFGGTLQLCWQLPSLHKLGFKFRPTFDWNDSGLIRILR